MKITRKKITASSVDKRLSFTSIKYKGYRISLDHKNSCYNIYDKHGELEDYGFTSQLAAKEAIDKLVKESEVKSSTSTSKLWMAKYYPIDGGVKKVYFEGPASISRAEKLFEKSISEPYKKYVFLGSAPSEKLAKQDGFSYMDVNASKKITADKDFEYLDNEDTIRELIDELAENGVDIYDDQDILQELGANYGYDRDDQFAILEDIREYVGQGINSAEEVEDDELETTEQEFTSKDTSINSSKLPAIYKFVDFPKGSVVLDFGGGKFDNGVEYLQSLGCDGYVYDPYNRTSEHNAEVVKAIRANGGADIVLNSNVLNVIKEPAARRTVLKNIKKLVKPSGKIYITVYEGNGSGEGKQSKKDSFQLNRKTADYLEEIQEVFPDATRKGKLIIATPDGAPANSSTNITSSVSSDDMNRVMMRAADVHDRRDLIELLGDIASIDQNMYRHYCDLDQSGEYSPAAIGKMISDDLYWKLDDMSNEDSRIMSAEVAPYKRAEFVKQLQDELYNKASEVMQSYEFGFPLEEVAEYLVVDVNETEDGYVVEVRAEVDYDGMVTLAESLDPIIQKYDADAYFDMVDPGIMEAYIRDFNIESSTKITSEVTYESEDYTEIEDSLEVELDFDSEIVVDEVTVDFVDDSDYEVWDDTYSPLKLDDSDSVVEHILDLITPNSPIQPGTYRVSGIAHLVYDVSNIFERNEVSEDGDVEYYYDVDEAESDYDPYSSYIESLVIEEIK